MDDSNLIQALRLLLGDKNIKEIKSVKLSMDDRGKDIISFKDQQDREVSMEVTIHYDNRSFDVV
jgi:urease accessory protein UreE